MRQLAFHLFLFIFVACNSSNSEKRKNIEIQQNRQTTEFEFKKEMYNFGELQAGEITVFTFIFENTGENNLWINQVDGDCGCITATFPKKPVKPGETGEIEIEFDSSGLHGKQMKTITVDANVPKQKQLAIFAEVKNEQLRIKY